MKARWPCCLETFKVRFVSDSPVGWDRLGSPGPRGVGWLLARCWQRVSCGEMGVIPPFVSRLIQLHEVCCCRAPTEFGTRPAAVFSRGKGKCVLPGQLQGKTFLICSPLVPNARTSAWLVISCCSSSQCVFANFGNSVRNYSTWDGSVYLFTEFWSWSACQTYDMNWLGSSGYCNNF